MEEDSFAFYIFSGFVAISTVISWAIVTWLTRENTYENAKRQAQQEDTSWMENASSTTTALNAPVKSNVKLAKTKKAPVKSKSKGSEAEHQVSSTSTSGQSKVQAPAVKAEPLKEQPGSAKPATAKAQSSESTKSKAKTPKTSPEKTSPSSVGQQPKDTAVKHVAVKKVKEENIVPVVAKTAASGIDIWADEESDHEEWTSVPMKPVKPTATASSTKGSAKHTNSETKAGSKKQETEHEKDKQAQGSQKLEVSLQKGGSSSRNSLAASEQVSPSSSLTTTEPDDQPQTQTKQKQPPSQKSQLSKLSVNNTELAHAASSSLSHYMSHNGEGSTAVSDGLEHSDSTEEIIERTTFSAPQNAKTAKAMKPVVALPSSSAKSNSNAKQPQASRAKPKEVQEARVEVTASKKVASAPSRSKRNSERSGTASTTSGGANRKNSVVAVEDTPETIQMRKLEDELKRERNHSSDLREKYIKLNDQIEKEKKTFDSVNQQLMLKVQENAELKSKVAQIGAQTSVSVNVPAMSAKEIEELQALRAEVKELQALRGESKRNEARFVALREENDVLRNELGSTKNELGSTKASLHGAKHEYQLQVQSAEAQLKQIDVKNKELQEQCNRYQMQLQNHSEAQSPAPDTPTHNQEANLLAQLTDTEKKLKDLQRENGLLKQHHDATFAEMSRLQDSKIALQKHNSSLQEEVQKLQEEISSSPKTEVPNGTVTSAAPEYDWSQVNSDLKKLAQLEVTVADLSQENENLREEKSRLQQQIHSAPAQILGDAEMAAANKEQHLHNGVLHDDDEEETVNKNGVTCEKGDAQDIISLKEVETELKKCVLRVYPDISNNTSMPSDCIAFIAQFEKHARSSMLQLSEKEDKLNQQVGSLNVEISKAKVDVSKAISERDTLAEKNAFYKETLNTTEALVVKLQTVLETVEAEHRELTEENNILRNDTARAVELQIELDEVKLELAKLQQNQESEQSEAKIKELEAKLATSTEKYENEKQQLQNQKSEIEESKNAIEGQLKSTETELADTKKSLDKQKFELEESKKTIEGKLKSTETELADTKKLLEKQKSELEESKKAIEGKLKSRETELADTKKSLEKQKSDLEESKKAVESKLKSTETELADTKKSLEEALASAANMAAISSAIDNNSDTQSIGSAVSVSTKDAFNDKGKEKEKKENKKDKDES